MVGCIWILIHLIKANKAKVHPQWPDCSTERAPVHWTLTCLSVLAFPAQHFGIESKHVSDNGVNLLRHSLRLIIYRLHRACHSEPHKSFPESWLHKWLVFACVGISISTLESGSSHSHREVSRSMKHGAFAHVGTLRELTLTSQRKRLEWQRQLVWKQVSAATRTIVLLMMQITGH